MVDFDPTILGWILPMLVSFALPFILLGINKSTKTSEGTISGTIRLEGVKSNVDELKTSMEKGFDKLEQTLNEKARENKNDFDVIARQLQDLRADVNLHEYRLKELERRRNGGNNSAV
jgi:hypothetical protein